MKYALGAFLILILTSNSFSIFAKSEDAKPKNIIMVVGDGMGPAYTTAYRYFYNTKQLGPDYVSKNRTSEIEKTVFDRHLVGMASTYPAFESGFVTDSAASATALSAGVKSYNGAIAVDSDKKPVETVLQWAKSKGMKTGVAVTSQINHATPASYAAHNEYRRNYNAIADSYFDDRVNDKFVLDVMLGGGWEYFIRDDRNLVEEFQQAGYQYIDQMQDLTKLTPNKPVLGLFGDTGMPWALDMPNHSRLPALTKAAVKQLENDKGFFLLVEGSQIDWSGHANDVASAMAEMDDFAKTLEWLEEYVESNPDTLVIVTADHSTGGLTIAANGDYAWYPGLLNRIKVSLPSIAKQMSTSDDPFKLCKELIGFELSKEEKQLLSEELISDHMAIYKALKRIIDTRTNTGWTGSGHTAVDVQVFAMGQSKERFAGHLDNTEIPKILFSLMGK